ncbi:MAG: hypothetical protein PHH26_04310 [Candidatus Thermoplasmatota archaeon]|nr:hypothetical protein [Candidatus Thermoplasmatota archaeon]
MVKRYTRLTPGDVLHIGGTDILEVTFVRDAAEGQTVKVRQLYPVEFDESFNDWFPTAALSFRGWEKVEGKRGQRSETDKKD